jgi:DNA-binding IclR family transcriptional regulator
MSRTITYAEFNNDKTVDEQRIVDLLVERPMNVNDVSKTLKMPQPTASRTLLVMEKKGYLVAKKIGHSRFYGVKKK